MYIEVWVTPDAKKEAVLKIDESHYEISVREPAARNLANTRVRELIAGACRAPIGQTRIIAGHRSPKKIIAIN